MEWIILYAILGYTVMTNESGVWDWNMEFEDSG